MPTYEYRCRDCGHTFDVVQAMSDETLTVCPACGGELRKVFAPPAISFKGSGFYATDHGKKSTSGEKTGEKPAASAGSSDGTGGKKDEKEPSKPKESSAAKGSDVSSSSTGSGSSSSTTSGSDGKKKGA